MTTTKSNILLPYLEDTGLDGNKLYTPKEWTERLRHYIKRIHDIDKNRLYPGKQCQQVMNGQQKNRK